MTNRQLLARVHRFVQTWSQDRSQTASSILNPILDTLPPNERPKVTATVSDLLRHWLLLEEIIRRFSRIKPQKLHPHLANLIHIAVYQLLFDPTIPNHAVLHAAVSLCIPHQKNFANGLLRAITRQKDQIVKELIPSLPLSRQKSFPQAFVDQLSLAYPHHPASDLLDYLNAEPVFHPIQTDELLTSVRKDDVDILTLFPGNHPRKNSQRPSQLDGLITHKTWIQNISSQFLSYFALHLHPKTILDLCAAPGGKSSLISLLAPDIQIVAQDLSLARLRRLQQRMNALPEEFPNLVLCCGDARKSPFSSHFDLIMLDAPCSALGTVRKHPDRRYDCSEERIKDLADNQFCMLEHALQQYPKTPILYSVCTFTKAETDDLLERLLDTNLIDRGTCSDAQERLQDALTRSSLPFQPTSFGAFILPDHSLDTDLFFIALLPPAK